MIRVIIPAHNEAARLGPLLTSLRGWAVTVVLDRCRDQTERVARDHGVRVVKSELPGKVEALRVGMREPADIYVCIDADVTVGPRTVSALVAALERDPSLRAACPPLSPVPSRWHTPLSWALYRYNAARGFSRERLWLSGRCYAVRGRVDFPTHEEMRQRANGSGPLLADDVWLSRYLHGQIAHVDTDPVRYQPPRTLRGMSRTYRRLRRELMRIDRLFPELPGPGRDRRIDPVHGLDRVALTIFNAALQLCRLHAVLEDAAERLGYTPDPWPVVLESKR